MGTATEDQSRGDTPARSTTSETGRERTAQTTRARPRARPAPATRKRPSVDSAPRQSPGQRPVRAPRMPFVLLILGLLGGALVSLLALRTVLIEDAFTVSQLQQENQELSDREDELREDVVHLESSDEVAESAEELGMEPGDAPLFLNVETGEVSGEGGSGPDEAGSQ